MVGLTLGAVAAILGLLLWVTEITDTVARETSVQLFRSAVLAKQDQVRISIMDYAHLEPVNPDVAEQSSGTVQDHIGTGVNEIGTFDFLFIVDEHGTPTHAYEFGGNGIDLSLATSPDARALIASVQGQRGPEANITEQFASINGGIAIVLAAEMTADHDGHGSHHQSAPVLIGGVFLDSDELLTMGGNLMIRGVTLDTSGAVVAHDCASLALFGPDNTQLGQIVWHAPSPGQEALRLALPVVLALSFFLILASVFVGRTSYRQSTSLIEEQDRARRDELTGLFNRVGLNEHIRSASFAVAPQAGQAAAIYLDLNKFKALNDEMGHDVGDRALELFANRLRLATRKNDVLARVGGDEFICLLCDPAPSKTARQVAARIQDLTARPIIIKDRAFDLRPSIGVAIASRGDTWRRLIQVADVAMYRAKRLGSVEPEFGTASDTTSPPMQLLPTQGMDPAR